MTRALRFAVLGDAKIARTQVVPAIYAAGHSVAVVGSRQPQPAPWAQALGAEWVDYQGAIEHPDVDAVYIALPHHLHAEWSVRALQAGRHVLCEKPMALSLTDADAVIAAQQQSGRVFFEGYMVRHHPQWWWLRDLDLGPIRHIQVTFTYDNRDPNNIRNIASMGGGALWDIGCYAVFAGHWLLGAPDQSNLRSEMHPEWQVDIHSRGHMAWTRRGARTELDFFVSTQTAKQQAVVLTGERGWARLDVPFNPAETSTALYSAGGLSHEATLKTFEPCNAYANMVADFASAIGGAAIPMGCEVAASRDIVATLCELQTHALRHPSGGNVENSFG